MSRILLIDNNCLNSLASPWARERLSQNLRATGRELWPTALNALEATKSRDRDKRVQLLGTLGRLAGDNLAFPLPTEALREVAASIARGSPEIVWADHKITRFFREPESVTDAEALLVREYLLEQEADFRRMHEQAAAQLRPLYKEHGAAKRWKSAAEYIEELWTRPDDLSPYIKELWSLFGLQPPAPVEAVLGQQPWRLFFDGLGAAAYARLIEHPQRPKVQRADLEQMVYLGSGDSAILASGDKGFVGLACEVLRGRYPRREVVPLTDMLR